jgi:hypothetical protein
MMMSLFGGVFGFSFGNDARAMSEDEILRWQISQQSGMRQADVWPYWYSQGLAQYQPPQRPLDERFADFKVRLAAAVERHKIGLAKPSQITPHKAGS